MRLKPCPLVISCMFLDEKKNASDGSGKEEMEAELNSFRMEQAKRTRVDRSSSDEELDSDAKQESTSERGDSPMPAGDSVPPESHPEAEKDLEQRQSTLKGSQSSSQDVTDAIQNSRSYDDSSLSSCATDLRNPPQTCTNSSKVLPRPSLNVKKRRGLGEAENLRNPKAPSGNNLFLGYSDSD
eukprot:Selendium_serpulae@DN5773_c0_g1_i4.p2